MGKKNELDVTFHGFVILPLLHRVKEALYILIHGVIERQRTITTEDNIRGRPSSEKNETKHT